MKKQVLVFLSVVLFSLINAQAAEQVLAKITNEEDTNISYLLVGVNDTTGDVERFFKLVNDNRGKIVKKETFEVSNVASSGLVLVNRSNRDIVKLLSSNFEKHNGGDIKVDYLYSGITGSRRGIMVDLNRIGDKWELLSSGRVIKSMHFVSNKAFLVGTVGVSRIDLRF